MIEANARAAVETDRRREALTALLLALLVVVLAVCRLMGAQGYATYKPLGMLLLEGWPASWEASYFLEHVPTFLGDGPSRLGIAPVDYRTYANLYLFMQLYGWTGSAYWSLAAVDGLFWIVATLCTWRLGHYLGLSPHGSVAAAVLLAGSPIYFAQMWHQDLHLSNLASLPMGLWAAAALVTGHDGRGRLAIGLAFLLVFLSVTYQYQWFVLPVAIILMACHPALRSRGAAVVGAGAIVLFVAASAALGGALSFSGLAATSERLGAVQRPLALVVERAASAADMTALVQELPNATHVAQMAAVYHPVVYWLGLAGLLTLARHGLALGVLGFVLPLFFMRLHPVPWVAMTAYPLIYVGAGRLCAVLGQTLMRLAVAGRATRSGGRAARLRGAVTIAAVIGLTALTNRDLWGDMSFLLGWWNLYSARPIH